MVEPQSLICRTVTSLTPKKLFLSYFILFRFLSCNFVVNSHLFCWNWMLIIVIIYVKTEAKSSLSIYLTIFIDY